jgi:hypothetical protein
VSRRIDSCRQSLYPPRHCGLQLAVMAPTLRAVRADITTLNVDAIVNASNEALLPKKMGLTRQCRMIRVLCLAGAVLAGCATGESKDAAKRDVAGPYQTWDSVIKRWVGGQVSDLYVELGPPNLHPHQMEDGTIQMVWDFGIDRMPGQADAYDLLPLYGGTVNCQLHFFVDQKGTILRGERIGCE